MSSIMSPSTSAACAIALLLFTGSIAGTWAVVR